MVAVNGERRSIAKLIRFTPSELERVSTKHGVRPAGGVLHP